MATPRDDLDSHKDEGEANGGEVGTKARAKMGEDELMEGTMPFKRRLDGQVFCAHV